MELLSTLLHSFKCTQVTQKSMTQSFQKLSFNPQVIDVKRCMFEHSKVLLNMVFVMKLLHAAEQRVYIMLTIKHLCI
jgi:hypothetical protein